MAQETYYFSHDYNPIGDDSAMGGFVEKHGAVGYGVYWRVVEKLHAKDDNRLPLKEYLYRAIAKELSINFKQVEEIIHDCIGVFELFKSDGESFWSSRVNKNIALRDKIIAQKSKAGKASAESRKLLKKLALKYNMSEEDLTAVEHPLTDAEQPLNSRQQRKLNEMKLN